MADKALIITKTGVEIASGADRVRWLERGRKAGWRVSEFGRLDDGTTVGPCSRCKTPCERYGDHGNPLCVGCRESTTSP